MPLRGCRPRALETCRSTLREIRLGELTSRRYRPSCTSGKLNPSVRLYACRHYLLIVSIRITQHHSAFREHSMLFLETEEHGASNFVNPNRLKYADSLRMQRSGKNSR